jgi:methylase of polypeptide subunit release factors
LVVTNDEIGVDINPVALELADDNRRQLGIKNCKFEHIDMMSGIMSFPILQRLLDDSISRAT